MDKYECICNFIYDPAAGDLEFAVPPGTPFEELPDDWVCIECGAEKDCFYRFDD